jgi:hypothetical protein
MPLSDPAPDNMAYFNSPQLNIDNMVNANKSTFDNILAAWTCHPEKEEIDLRGLRCDPPSPRRARDGLEYSPGQLWQAQEVTRRN